MKKILIFGSNGLLGWYITTYFKNKNNDYIVNEITRKTYNILSNNIGELNNIIANNKPDYIINCTNCFKDTFSNQVYINSLFPQKLSKICNNRNIILIHISTNGVFSGITGNYTENDTEDANDSYGITKLLGENINNIVIRTSIIGEQVIQNNKCIYFLDWIKSCKNTNVIGYNKHLWNGVTCLELAKYIDYIISNNITWSGVRHLCNTQVYSKYDLIKIINRIYYLNLHIVIDENNIKKHNLNTIYYNYMTSSIENQIYEQYIFTKVNSKQKGNYNELKYCRFCNTSTVDILHLGDNFGLAGAFLSSLNDDELISDKLYPLTLSLCNKCKYIQCKQVVSSDELFKKHYYYYSSTIDSLVRHFKNLAEWIYTRYPDKNSKIIEIGCNDGVLLHPLKNLGYNKLIGVDPSDTVKNIDKNITVYNEYFNTEIANSIINAYGLQDIFISCNSFAHIHDMNSVITNIKNILKPNTGIAIIEVHNSINIFKEKNFDFIYHEHMGYYTVTSIYNICKNNNISLTDVEFINNHGGSLRCTLTMIPNIENITINKIILNELHILNTDFFVTYKNELYKWRDEFRELIIKLRKDYKVYGYGASGRANTILNFCEIELDGIIDDSPNKIDCYTPIYNTKIYSSDLLYTESLVNKQTYCVILAWPYASNIIEKNKNYTGKFIIPLPNIHIQQ